MIFRKRKINFMNEHIIYIDKEEIMDFCLSGADSNIGYAYEWENENVIHLHLHPVKHSFGDVSRILFAKDGIAYTEQHDYRFIVVAGMDSSGELNCKVKEMVQGAANDVAFMFLPSRDELYSRSKGLLEIDILKDKRVSIIGLGSFGSQIAIELAKAGVGNFGLFDFDRVELHNLARHTSTRNDLGRLKTDVIEDSIKGKNPYASVEKFPIDINEDIQALEEEIAKTDIVICATDNNPSRYSISKLLVKYGKTGIFGRAITRAEGGDVFRYVPGGPCYCCLIGATALPSEEVSSEAAGRRSGAIQQYTDANDVEAVVQVGLSADIEPICNLMVKLALVELSKGMQSGISSLEDDFVFNYYIWANRRERHYARWAEFPNSANRPTVMRWYGAVIGKNDGCPVCSSENIVLDEGDSLQGACPEIPDMSDVDLDKERS